MKNPKLWSAIRNFEFDELSDVYGFTLRLAKENLWTRDFTLSAIEEYRRFMYLAAISEQMVSPSHIIDQVWHLHLIYTKSYDQLCDILSKKVSHVPATHNPQEGRIYIDARSRTNELYKEEFGIQSPEIWVKRDMTDTLNLPKAKFKLRAFIIVGLFAIAILVPLLYFVLRPVYSQISPAAFITGYLIAVALLLAILNVFNRARMASTFEEFPHQSFIHRLSPSELIYLQYNRVEAVTNGYINHLVKQGNIAVHADGSVELAKDESLYVQEEVQIVELLKSTGKISFELFMKKLLARNIFSNIGLCMEAAKKYYHKSLNFHRLFYLNFCVLGILFILGFERIITGILRDKPIVIITLIMLIVLIAIVIHLLYLNRMMFSRIIPDAYEITVKSKVSLRSDWQWNYFLQGTAVFAPAFLLIANMSYVEQMNTTDKRTGSGGTSCGSSCGGGGGSSCGSSCGGGSCGGCGG